MDAGGFGMIDGEAGGGVLPIQTRREYVPVGSVAASLLLTVWFGNTPPPASDRGGAIALKQKLEKSFA